MSSISPRQQPELRAVDPIDDPLSITEALIEEGSPPQPPQRITPPGSPSQDMLQALAQALGPPPTPRQQVDRKFSPDRVRTGLHETGPSPDEPPAVDFAELSLAAPPEQTSGFSVSDNAHDPDDPIDDDSEGRPLYQAGAPLERFNPDVDAPPLPPVQVPLSPGRVSMPLPPIPNEAEAEAPWEAVTTDEDVDEPLLDDGPGNGPAVRRTSMSADQAPTAQAQAMLAEGMQQAMNEQAGEGAPTDSLNFGQLKQLVNQFPKQKPTLYTYRHDDTDTTMAELEEFFSYIEIANVVNDGRDSFLRGWNAITATGWPEAPAKLKRRFLRDQLERLEHRSPEVRFEAARRLAYAAQGTAVFTGSPEEQLAFIIQNCTLLRDIGGVQAMFDAIKTASSRWSSLSHMGPSESESHDTGPRVMAALAEEKRLTGLEEINAELSFYLSVLYFILETSRGDETFADELMTLDPPLPIYLLSLVANLREKNAKGYPVKKLLLVLWKSLLATLGGAKDISRVKRFVREVEGLPADPIEPPAKLVTKVAPPDFQAFRAEITSKYPTYVPPNVPTPIPVLDLERIAQASAPAPIRPLYPYTQSGSVDLKLAANGADQPNAQAPGLATPAPSPPPSPKPKKQQYQTDQSRPFVMPFSNARSGKEKAVPKSIEEAGELFRKNVRVSTELWQTTKVREEYIADETGIAAAIAGAHGGSTTQDEMFSTSVGAADDEAQYFSSRASKLNGLTNGFKHAPRPEPPRMDPLQMLERMEASLRQDLPHKQGKPLKELQERIADIKRLQRIELIYRAVLPSMQSVVIVLLKLLLATVTSTNNSLSNLPSTTEEEQPEQQLNLEEMDIMRHREITSKAVSAILILMLRWFKTSHVMKFQYLAQLLVDSNCLLLILKMFGLQEVSNQVKTRHESAEHNFFAYCLAVNNGTAPPPPRPEDAMLAVPPAPRPPPANGELPVQKEGEEEVELIHDYSHRNFLAIINFLHILQKLTKRKVHRILLLTQYKSSAILKRILKVSHPLLQVYTLKVIKSQIPYCGRKWRQSNMKVITAIYLHCRPDLRDDWLMGVDIDADVEESLPQEHALRALISFFNQKHYSVFAPQLHRRSNSSLGAVAAADANRPAPSPGLHAADESFPPSRPPSSFRSTDSYFRSSYLHDKAWLEDYEDLLGDLLTPCVTRQGPSDARRRYTVDSNGVPSLVPDDSSHHAESAWNRLSAILGESEDISDSESVGSINVLNLSADNDSSLEEAHQPDWAEMSPKIITALEEERQHHLGSPRSPRPRRTSSGPKSPALRPVFLDVDRDEDERDENAMQDEEEDERLGIAPVEKHSTPPVDEIEAVFGY